MAVSATFDPGDKIRRMFDLLDDVQPLMDIAGLHVQSAAHDAFEDQAWDGQPWAQRPNPNWAGVMADLMAGKNVKPRRTQDGPALTDTGTLRGSIGWQQLTKYTMSVGSNLNYSGKLDRGEKGSIGPWDRNVRAKLYQWLIKQQSQELADDMGWLLNEKWTREPVEWEHPERQFVGVTDEVRERINRDIVTFVVGI